MHDLTLTQANQFIEFPSGTTHGEIINSIEPATQKEMAKSISALFTARKASNRGDTDAIMTVQVYEMALSGLPAFAIEAAVFAIIKGKAPNIAPVFVPSTDELVAEVERQMWMRIRVTEEPKAPEPILPAEHFSKRWKDLKKDAMNAVDITPKDEAKDD